MFPFGLPFRMHTHVHGHARRHRPTRTRTSHEHAPSHTHTHSTHRHTRMTCLDVCDIEISYFKRPKAMSRFTIYHDLGFAFNLVSLRQRPSRGLSIKATTCVNVCHSQFPLVPLHQACPKRRHQTMKGGLGEARWTGIELIQPLGVDSPFFSTIVLFSHRICFPRVFHGFLKRFGSLERMEMEGTLRGLSRFFFLGGGGPLT